LHIFGALENILVKGLRQVGGEDEVAMHYEELNLFVCQQIQLSSAHHNIIQTCWCAVHLLVADRQDAKNLRKPFHHM